MHRMLDLRYAIDSNILAATWFDDDLCMLQKV